MMRVPEAVTKELALEIRPDGRGWFASVPIEVEPGWRRFAREAFSSPASAWLPRSRGVQTDGDVLLLLALLGPMFLAAVLLLAAIEGGLAPGWVRVLPFVVFMVAYHGVREVGQSLPGPRKRQVALRDGVLRLDYEDVEVVAIDDDEVKVRTGPGLPLRYVSAEARAWLLQQVRALSQGAEGLGAPDHLEATAHRGASAGMALECGYMGSGSGPAPSAPLRMGSAWKSSRS